MKKMFKIAVILVMTCAAFTITSCKKELKPQSKIGEIYFNGVSNSVYYDLPEEQYQISMDGGLIVTYLNFYDENVFEYDNWVQIPRIDAAKVSFEVVYFDGFLQIFAYKFNEGQNSYPFAGPKKFKIKTIAIPAEKKIEFENTGFDYTKASFEELSSKI